MSEFNPSPAKAQAPFRVVLPDGSIGELPSMSVLPYRYLSRIGQAASLLKMNSETATLRGQEIMAEVQLQILDRYLPGATDVWTREQVEAVMSAWADHSKASLGESQAS